MKSLNLRSVFAFCGACVAFYIGAGFATMQEIMQYDVSYGSGFILSILAAALVFAYTNISFTSNANRHKIEHGNDIYLIYGGKYIGRFFDFFAAFFCYMCFIVMCGGANSTATQQWGLPRGLGAILLTVAVVATGIFGLKGILNALSKLAPVIITLILTVSIISIVMNYQDFKTGLHLIDSGQVQPTQTGGGHPLLAGATYSGFVIFWFAAFMAEIGTRNPLREVNLGMFLATLFIFGSAAIASVALINKIQVTAEADIPSLILANKIHPWLAQFFAIVIFCGIYTTAVPLLWTGVSRIAPEGSGRYKLMTLVGGAIGCLIALLVPFKGLVKILYGINGYLGFVMLAIMIFSDIMTRMGRRPHPFFQRD